MDLRPTSCPLACVYIHWRGSQEADSENLAGIRQHGSTYQVRIYGGYNLVRVRQLVLAGSAATEDTANALKIRSATLIDIPCAGDLASVFGHVPTSAQQIRPRASISTIRVSDGFPRTAI
jgi:hypothetical protein